MSEPQWQQLEILVAKIQQELAPDATVQHNIKLKGRESEQMRQIDVLVSQRIGQYEMLIVIDCKDYKHPVDVKGIEEFYGLVTDVAAHRGAMVCPKGFTKSAKMRARRLQIDLYSPADTDPHKWQVKATIPVVCDFRGAKVSFQWSCSAAKPFMIPHDFFSDSTLFDKNTFPLGTPLEIFKRRWGNGELIHEPGVHHDIPLVGDGLVLADNGYGELIEITLKVALAVDQRLYFGMLPIAKIKGLRDEHTGGVITNAFTTGDLDAEEVEKCWQKLKSREDLPKAPALEIMGLDCYE